MSNQDPQVDTTEFLLSRQQYEALIALAREGTKNDEGQVDQSKALALDTFLKKIEKDNGVERYAIWVQWQEMNSPLPPNTNFPEVWPPQMRAYIEKVTGPISRADIDHVLASKAKKPTSILFTKDPGATYGWTPIDQYT